jgi:hypothetical protein
MYNFLSLNSDVKLTTTDFFFQLSNEGHRECISLQQKCLKTLYFHFSIYYMHFKLQIGLYTEWCLAQVNTKRILQPQKISINIEECRCLLRRWQWYLNFVKAVKKCQKLYTGNNPYAYQSWRAWLIPDCPFQVLRHDFLPIINKQFACLPVHSEWKIN